MNAKWKLFKKQATAATVIDADGIVVHRGGSLIAVPSAQIALHTLDLPVKSSSQAQKLAPFALEDNLSEDLSHTHLALKREGDSWFAWVCSRHLMQDWIDILLSDDISVESIIPDYFLLPARDHPVWLQEGDTAIVRLDRVRGFAAPEALLGAFLDRLQMSVDQCEKLDVTLVSLADTVTRDQASVNLLQGEFNIRSSAQDWLNPWLGGVAAGLFAFLIYVGYLALENQELQRNVQAQRALNIQLFKKTFPEERRVVNLRVQAQQKFEQLSVAKKLQSTSLLAILAQSIPILEGNPDVKVAAIQYDNFVMQLHLLAPSLSAAEAVNKKFQELGELEVTVEKLSQESGSAKTTINIRKVI